MEEDELDEVSGSPEGLLSYLRSKMTLGGGRWGDGGSHVKPSTAGKSTPPNDDGVEAKGSSGGSGGSMVSRYPHEPVLVELVAMTLWTC